MVQNGLFGAENTASDTDLGGLNVVQNGLFGAENTVLDTVLGGPKATQNDPL